MAESRLFRQTFFIWLALTAAVRTTRDSSSSGLADAQSVEHEAPNEIYAQRVMNIHQPVYQPGYGNFQMVKPMFLTPPPPAIEENLILKPSPIHNSKEIRIATKTKVMTYPMQFANQFNYYSFPRTYNPYFGKEAPANVFHPFNMLYGPQQYTPLNSYGLPNLSDSSLPYISHKLQKTRFYESKDLVPLPPKTRTFFASSDASESDDNSLLLVDNSEHDSRSGDERLLVTQKAQPPQVVDEAGEPQERKDKKVGHSIDDKVLRQDKLRAGLIDPAGFGFNTLQGVEFDPFSTQFGAFGPYSPYSGSMERQLSLARPALRLANPLFQMI